ncbi:hypothetical protein D0T51_00150 [Parabacteroides sp. 52]|uniref:hypothetical protein n=1 Tax=unclassified Parabacteroides TaxID=2649774 RepID=UPI0013D203FC|nr:MULTISPECIES: hypothetical protein [unclassified Parabacteroides]MDH6533389.1 hypothetical protein [Parabacteroides sp. PM5-20]NDV54147.1 hypothetical protein [Parabacteroides sp. 52]
MRIALVLDQKRQDEVDRHVSQVVIFTIENDKVIGVENETIDATKQYSLSLWALTNKVNEIYVSKVDDWVKMLSQMMGVNIRAYDELRDDKLFQTFIL